MTKKYILLIMIVILSFNVFALYSTNDQTVEGSTGSDYGRGMKIVPTANISVYNISLFGTTANTNWTRVRIFNSTTEVIGTATKLTSETMAYFSSPISLVNGTIYYVMGDGGASCPKINSAYRNSPAQTDAVFGDIKWTGRYYFPSNCGTISFEGSAGNGDIGQIGYSYTPLPPTPLNFTYTKTCFFNGTGLSLNLMSGCY